MRYAIIDMDGVLYRGTEVIRGTCGFLTFLRDEGIRFVLATNNSTRTPGQYAQKLAKMGVTVGTDEILTSAQAAAQYLSEVAPPRSRVFVIGQDGLQEALRQRGFELVEEDAEYVVVGMDFTVRYERLAQATLLLRAGAKFIATNPDRTFPSERGIVPGAGSLLAFLEAASDKVPVVVGKPGTKILEQAMARMDAAAETTVMLGDRLETDILAGQRLGLTTILVLSGVTNASMLEVAPIRPDLVLCDVAVAHRVWREAIHG